MESTYQELLCTLDRLSCCVYDNPESVCNLDMMETCDLDTVKNLIEQNRVSFMNHALNANQSVSATNYFNSSVKILLMNDVLLAIS